MTTKQVCILLTTEEREQFAEDAKRSGMWLRDYLRDKLGLPRIELQSRRDYGTAPWLHAAIQRGYPERELRHRARMNGLTLKQVCKELAG